MKPVVVILFIIAIVLPACGNIQPAPTATQIPTNPPPPTQTATEIPPTETKIPTSTPIPGTIVLDFVASLCDAQWMNGGQHLVSCPDVNADHSGGYATPLDPTSEGLPAGTPVLLTIPATNGYGGLFLQYPPITIHAGDRFSTALRCQSKAPCVVEYALEYFDSQGKYSRPFLAWNYRHGDPEVVVDSDLSKLAGQTVEFVLTLRPLYDAPQLDQTLWIAPYIYRPVP